MKLKQVLLVLVFSIGGFLCGYSMIPEAVEVSHDSSPSLEKKNKLASFEGNEEDNKSLSKKTESIDKNRQLSLSDLAALYGRIGSENLNVSVEVYEAICSLPKDKVKDYLVEIMPRISHDPVKVFLAYSLLTRYAFLSPSEAREFFEKELKSKGQFFDSLLSGWVKADASGALNYYLKQDVRAVEEHVLSTILAHIYEKNQAAALEAFKKLEMKYRFHFANFIHFTNEEELAKNLAEVKGLREFSRIKARWLGNLAENNLDAALRWYESSEEECNIVPFLRAFCEKDWKAAIHWQMGREERLVDRINNMIHSLPYNREEDIFNWLQEQQGEDYVSLRQAVLDQCSYTKPDFAAEQLHVVKDNEKRKKIALQVYQTLKKKDAKKAAVFLNSSEFKEELLKR